MRCIICSKKLVKISLKESTYKTTYIHFYSVNYDLRMYIQLHCYIKILQTVPSTKQLSLKMTQKSHCNIAM